MNVPNPIKSLKLMVRAKLLIGFGVVLTITTAVSIINFVKMRSVSEVEHRVIDLRVPTVQAGMHLTDGIHLSLAGLRGYMILGKNPVAAKKFKAERQAGWDLIDQAATELDAFSKGWTVPRNVELLNEMKGYIEEFRIAQQEVEDIAHAHNNIPAIAMLLDEAAPRAGKILASISATIDEEVNQPASPERKELLKLLADSRGSFAIGLANIRAYLLSGDSKFADNFHAKWKVNVARFDQISRMSDLFTPSQTRTWNIYTSKRAEFASLPDKMFELRAAKDWNQANYWLGTKAAPKAVAIMNILKQMRKSQDRLQANDVAFLDSETKSMEITMIIGTLIALGIGIIIAIYISRMITIPLQSVMKRAQSIADGDLTGNDLNESGHDELAQLATTINDMNNSLREMVQKVTGSTAQLGAASEELSATTKLTSQNLYEQQSQTEQVATAMNEMSATVQEVSQNISNTAQSAEDANSETAEGRHIVEQTVGAIQQLSTQIESAANVIHELEQDSENINAVLDVIKGVAEQTNLLALNAAIEAARAGEQGRGFAVVADEVRTLAGRTQESTTEINQVIEKLQTGSRKAVEVMGKSVEEAQSVVEQATAAGTSLTTISTAVERIHDMSIQIAGAAEEQNATAEEINRNIINITQAAGEASDGAKQTATASDELARLGNELQDMVAHFKV
ncbi:Methyl-accepting chemotaxis sensor/transducer protein [hydrothermal vent metagenome]|uniref:Methyl-accepting chemotaxis sensor/transducer protein n=1 Tax=hydrothermal vent metagenome TaxID=652676 RepID=A0A3B1ANL9_9ZZZZ